MLASRAILRTFSAVQVDARHPALIGRVAPFGDRHQSLAKGIHQWSLTRERGGFQLAHRCDLGGCAGEKHLISDEQLRLVDRTLHHRDPHAAGQLDHAGTGDALEDVLIHPGGDQDTVAHDEQVHAAGLADLAAAVEQQGFVETAEHRFGLGQRTGDVSAADLAAQGQGTVFLTGPGADPATDALGGEVVTQLEAIDQKVGFDVVQPWRDAEVTRVNERSQVDRFGGPIRPQHRGESLHHDGFTQVGQQQPGALTEATGMAIGTEQKHVIRSLRIGNGPHAAKSARAVVERVGRDRHLRF